MSIYSNKDYICQKNASRLLRKLTNCTIIRDKRGHAAQLVRISTTNGNYGETKIKIYYIYGLRDNAVSLQSRDF